MAQDLKASVSFVGDGTTTKFYFGFDYISKQFIKVAVGTDDTILSYPTDYTVNDKEVEFVEAPAKDTPIRIYRQTDSSRIIEWSDGSFIKASQMTLENVQQLHLIEESQDYVIINGMSKYPDGVNFNALGARVINVADPKEPQDAVTKHYMELVQGGFVSQNTALVEQATTQATNAQNSASSAATSASQSASSASASETSNQSAKKWAESTDSPDNQADTDSMTGKTQSSRSWALYSKTKAQEAATSASTATTQANTATTQATNAKNSASQSANSASASATSASNAKTSETNAKASETQAGTSERNAKVSEQNAAESAKIATEYGGDFNMLKRNKAYEVGDIAYSSYLPSWARLGCVTAGTTADTVPSSMTTVSSGGLLISDGTVTWIVDDVRDMTPVGCVRGSLFLPKGYIKANGATVQRADYPRLVHFIEINNLWTDDTTNNAGLFGKGDGSSTFVLPDYRERMMQYTDDSIGAKRNAGLPNITGTIRYMMWTGEESNIAGSFRANTGPSYGQGAVGGSSMGGITVSLDASRSCNIYGSSSTVQPPAINVIPILRY